MKSEVPWRISTRSADGVEKEEPAEMPEREHQEEESKPGEYWRELGVASVVPVLVWSDRPSKGSKHREDTWLFADFCLPMSES